MKRITIIADDVTGACDTGIKLLPQGRSVEVFIDSDSFDPTSTGADVVAIATNTRAASPREAGDKLLRLFEGKEGADFGILYKKVDSLLRGNTGYELEVMLPLLGCDAAVLAPSLPENGRRMDKGLIYADLADGSQDIIPAADRVHATTSLPTKLIPLKIVRSGADLLSRALEEQVAKGAKILLVDAWDQTDLATIAQAASSCRAKLLLAGSAGLAASLYRGSGPVPPRRAAVHRENNTVLAVIGSVSPSTVQQIQELKRNGCADFCILDTPMLQTDREQAMLDGLRQTLLLSRTGIRVLTSERTVQNAAIPTRYNNSRPDITRVFAELAALTVEQTPVNALLLSGGDIAEAFFTRMGVRKLTLMEEVLPGLVAVRFMTGTGKALIGVTKSGSFGTERSLVDIIDYLSTVQPRS